MFEVAHMVKHTHQVLELLESTLTHSVDIETGMRGYLITTNPDFLEPYQKSINKLDSLTESIRTKTADNLIQQHNLAILDSLLKVRIKHCDSVINTLKNKGVEAAAMMVRSGNGKYFMDKVRAQVEVMNQEEENLLAIRSDAERKAKSTQSTMLYTSLSIILVFPVFLYISLRRYPTLLEKSKKELTQKVEEQTADLLNANIKLHQEIDERTKAQEAIIENEKKYRHVLDAMMEGCQVISFDWKLLYINPAAEAQNRRSNEELLGKNFIQSWPDIESTEVFQKIKHCMEERTPQTMENLFVFPDGTTGYFDLKIHPVKEGIVILSHDISNRKKAEKNLENAMLKLQEQAVMLDVSTVITRNMNDEIIFWSSGMKTLYGWFKEEVLGKKAHELFQTEFSEPLEDIMTNLLQNGYWNGELTHVNKQGVKIPVASQWTLQYDENHTPKNIIEVNVDITHRKQAEKELQKMTNLFQSLFDSSPDGIILVNSSGEIIETNKHTCLLFGYTKEELLGTSIETLVPSRFKWHETLRQQYNSNPRMRPMGISQQLYAKRKDDTEFQVEITLSPVEINSEMHVIATVRDITEKKLLESQFLRAQRMESIGTLAGGMAHDLNNILAPILMSVGYLITKVTDSQSKKMLEMLEVNTKRGADLIRQVLTFARGIEGERSTVQVRHLIDDIAKIINETFPKYITVHTSIPKELPTISADPTQIHQILMNLCINARDAMPDGGKIEIAAEEVSIDEQYVTMHIDAKVGKYLVVSVSDQGIGMPPGVMDRIFEPFFTTKELGKGTGLGLSTVITIIKSHGGFVNVYSEVGRGTDFKIYLSLSEELQSLTIKDQEQTFIDGNNRLILVVDDEETIRETTKLALELFGFKVITADDGTEAIAAYAVHQDRISLVITDMMMPHMDGTATVRALQKMNPDVKVIVVSGLKQNGHTVNDKTVKFIHKPYTTEKLLNTIAELIEQE